jgi:glycosyltransferase involved in cell wall biosynthesis
MEILFVDDGSQDKTQQQIIQNATSMNLNFRVFRHNWKGLGYSRNLLLKNAQSDYIVWIDDGTIIPKDYIRRLVTFMEKHPSVGIAKGVIGVYLGSNRIATLENMKHLAFARKYGERLPGAGGAIYRIEAAKQVGGFNESILGAGEDTDIASRLSSAGWGMLSVKVEFFADYTLELKKVWKKEIWYGYGAHFVLHNNKELRHILYKSTPLAGLIEGLLAFSVAYRLTHKKIAFLLPIYYFSERMAWCIGFSKGHVRSYGH